jgi:hypothetical protein
LLGEERIGDIMVRSVLVGESIAISPAGGELVQQIHHIKSKFG